MKYILLILLLVLITSSSDNSRNKVSQKLNLFHNKIYDCIINHKELSLNLTSIMKENKEKLEKNEKPLRVAKIIPKFSSLDENDQNIIIECKKNITLELGK